MTLAGVRPTIEICSVGLGGGRLRCRDSGGRRRTFCDCTTVPHSHIIPVTRRHCTWTIHMHEDGVLNRAKGRGMGTVAGSQYTARDFQLEVLDRLAEVQEFAASLEQSWEKKLDAVKEQRLV